MGEYEPLFGMKGMVGVTIWPDKSYVTVKTRLYNPSNAMQTFHWWANLAVHANEDYQLQFPPDIDYITYHYKDAVSEFPVVRENLPELISVRERILPGLKIFLLRPPFLF